LDIDKEPGIKSQEPGIKSQEPEIKSQDSCAGRFDELENRGQFKKSREGAND
jgi:hypothetical protein